MKYKSDILEVVYKSAHEKYEIGAISKERMCEYDEMCLVEGRGTSQNFAIEKEQHIEITTP